MRNSIAIARKELNIYFATPIAYVMFTLFVVIGSFFFLSLLSQYEYVSLQYMRMNNPELMNRLNFQDMIFRGLFGNLGVILIFIVPFLTMRLIAEEKRTKTIELLYTTPITPLEIVLGKYLACLSILAVALGLTLLYPALLQALAKDTAGVEWRSVLLGYLGLFLIGAALITFVVLLMSWIVGWSAQKLEGWFREFVLYLTAVTHLESFSRGVVEPKDLVYFLSIVLLGLFATHRAVEAHRWS
jgi:ABC-2 type transport system permease protein